MQRWSSRHPAEENSRPVQEGIVVWDQHGIVVVWPDGHSSRVPWGRLRQVCACAKCEQRRLEEQPARRAPRALSADMIGKL